MSMISGGADGYSNFDSKETLPLKSERVRFELVKKIAKVARIIGGAGAGVAIWDALTNPSLDISDVIGQISTIVFGFAVGNLGVAAISAAISPIWAAVISMIFIGLVSLVLAYFVSLYFSLIFDRRSFKSVA